LGASIQEFRPDQYKELRAINRILETHELVPVDTRPFDPALCGFKRVDAGYVLAQSDSVSDVWVTPFDQTGLMDISCESGSWVCPWPATHADGETLLRLLGVTVSADFRPFDRSKRLRGAISDALADLVSKEEGKR